MKLCILTALALLLATACMPAQAWKQDRFIVTFWWAPPATDKELSAVAAEGYNLTWASVDELDVVGKHGLRALVEDPLLAPKMLDNPEQRAKLDALVEHVSKHPAAEGYLIIDEPGAGAFPALGRLVAYLRERDPGHFAYINLFPTYATKEQLGVSADEIERAKVGIPLNFAGEGAGQETILAYKEHLRQYLDIVKPDLISYDHYHFLKDRDGDQYFLNLELIREAALGAKLPFINIIQACTLVGGWRLVTKDELRFLVYTTMAYGGRGISYFVYWGKSECGPLCKEGVQTPLGLDAAALNREMNVLSPQLMKLESKAVYHTEPVPFGARPVPVDCPVQIVGKCDCVLGLFGEGAETDTFMIVNRDYRKSSAVRLAFQNNVKGLREFDRKTTRWRSYCKVKPGGPVTVEMKAGDGRLFKMVGNLECVLKLQ